MSEPTSWRVLGLDIGIASVGWTVLEFALGAGRVLGAGVYALQAPEERDSHGNAAASNKQRHGEMKRRRRQTARRAARMSYLRRRLHENEPIILVEAGLHGLATALRRCAKGMDVKSATPWQLRSEGLRRLLTADEWAVVLGHLVGHRAYSSNAKRSNRAEKKGDQRQKVLESLKENDKAFTQAVQEGQVATVGEWLGQFQRQRNRLDDYRFSVRREWIVDEAKLLFARQRAYRSPFAASGLENDIVQLIQQQKKIEVKPVNKCTLEINEDRAAKHCYSFELFRVLHRLNNIRIISSKRDKRLTSDEINSVVNDFGSQQTITYKTLRRLLRLQGDESFDHVPSTDAEAEDIVARKGKGVPGTSALRKIIIGDFGEDRWRSLVMQRDTLDGIAAAIAHNVDLAQIREALQALGLGAEMTETLIREADGGDLGFFKGTGHLSLKALRKLERHLMAGKDYFQSLCAACYDPSKDRFSRRPGIVGEGAAAVREWLGKGQIEELTTSQVTSRAVRESIKQVLAILDRYGSVDAIHLEMAREVGKSADQRNKIEKDQHDRASRRAGLRKSFCDTFGRLPSEAEETRWTLWSDQLGKCAFTGRDMHCSWVIDGDERVQVEHILPRSRFRIDAMDNKVLCLAFANHNKGTQTPYEWLANGGGPVSWNEFRDRAQQMFKGKVHQRKLGNLLLVDTTRLEQSFKNRDINDTRWITKFLLAVLAKLSTLDRPIKIQPVNAGIVGLLRHGWGLDKWKRDPKDPKKRRSDDRHHALDAAIVATIDQRLVGRLTLAYQRAEAREEDFPIRCFQPPWPNFRRDVIDLVYGDGATDAGPDNFMPDANKGIFVVRPENRRARGPVHKENYYAVRKIDRTNEVACEYIPIKEFQEEDLSRLKDKERQHRLVAKLEDWIARGRPMDQLPTWRYSDRSGAITDQPLRRVRVYSRHTPTIRVETGSDRKPETPKPSVAVAAGGIVRVDVFSSPNGNTWLVPVYRHHLRDARPPSNAVVNGAERALDPHSCFRLSIYQRSYLRVTTDRDTVIEGYFRNFDRDSSRIELTPQYTLDKSERSRATASRIVEIEKVCMNRLGLWRRNEGAVTVSQETRTWHGAVCT